jgi:UDP-N-acetylmuramoyl-tripeptide--D-alanyl-D-alanine ligase
MNFWTVDNLKIASGGQLIARAANAGAVDGLSTDSRAVRAGQCFLALAGEKFDGHDFIAQVVDAGVTCVIVQREVEVGPGVSVIRVSDTRAALGKIAHTYRKSLTGTKVVAICGSNGKTTTTRLIDAALRTKLRGTAPIKSFNNDIGVPITILSAKPGDQYLLCEVGSNAPGEISALGRIVEPDIAVLTSIGREHLQGFGDLRGVAREEASIMKHLRPGGVLIATGDAPELGEFIKYAQHLVTFGRSSGCDLRVTSSKHAPVGPGGAMGLSFEMNERFAFTLGLVGEHNALNALAAVAVAKRFGLSEEQIAQGLASATGPEMRLQSLNVAGTQVLNDAYNANPESMLAAIRAFVHVHAASLRRVMVMGDMLELGDQTEPAHREIGRAIAAEPRIDVLIAIGPKAQLAADEASKRAGLVVHRVPDTNDAALVSASEWISAADAVLLKGSRGLRLERIVKALAARKPALSSK